MSYAEDEETPVSPSDLLGEDVSEADVRAATERLRGRLGTTVTRKRREPFAERRQREPRRPAERRERLAERQEPAECAVEAEETLSPAGPAGSAGAAGTASVESGDECKAVYRVYAKWGGADGAIGEGLTGTLTSGHMCAVLGALGVGPRTTFVDIGAADGRVLVCAAMLGARRVVGYELPEPGKTHELVMNGARGMLSAQFPGRLTDGFEYVKRDIRQVGSLPEGTTAVYSFWDGFMPRDQEHVLRLMAACPTLESACVFLKAKSWKREALEAYLAERGRAPESAQILKVGMHGSGERKSAIVLRFYALN